MTASPLALTTQEPQTPKVGALIRARRRQLQLTLRDICEAAGITPGYLSQVERDLATPSLGTLAQIAHSLNVGVDYFIASPGADDALTRHGERETFSVPGSDVVYERVAADFAGNQLSSFVLNIPPGFHSEIVSHEGEEILFVLEGKLTQMLDGAEYIMRPGDSLHFRGNRPHAWWNDSQETVRVLWTGTVPVYRTTRRNPAGRNPNDPGLTTKISEIEENKTMKHLHAALFAATALLPLTALQAYAATPKDTLVVAENIDDIVSIDPAEAYEFSSGEYVTQTYDRLVQYDATTCRSSRPVSQQAGRLTMRPRRSPSRCATASSSPPAIRCAPKTSYIPSSASSSSTRHPPSC